MNDQKNILLVEDSQNDVELMLATLEEAGLLHEVVVVRDGAEALDYLFRLGNYVNRKAEDPIVILLDIKMPKVSGLEVLRALRADPQLQTLPVVILTSSREEKDIRESYKLGTNAYVVKPVDFEQYTKAIEDIGRFWGTRNEPPPTNTEK
ncbi:MAG: response regulator [Candidatus Binatia bacterium]